MSRYGHDIRPTAALPARFFHERGEKQQPESRWSEAAHPVFTGYFFLLLYLLILSLVHFWFARYQFTWVIRRWGFLNAHPEGGIFAIGVL